MRKDTRLVECCMTKLIATAGQTIRSLCSKLCNEYHSQHILLVFSDLLRVNVEMLRNRHVHTIIVCITYYASVTIAPHKNFKEIITDYKRILTAQGANVNAQTEQGHSPLQIVLDYWGQDHHLYDFLAELGAYEMGPDL